MCCKFKKVIQEKPTGITDDQRKYANYVYSVYEDYIIIKSFSRKMLKNGVRRMGSGRTMHM